MEIPRKLTVSMFNVTVIILRDIVESVIEDIEEVRDMGGWRRCRRCFFRRWRAWRRDTLLLPDNRGRNIRMERAISRIYALDKALSIEYAYYNIFRKYKVLK